jgi:hypothetical protein
MRQVLAASKTGAEVPDVIKEQARNADEVQQLPIS